MMENSKRIYLTDMPNHCLLCPDSGSVRNAQINSISSGFLSGIAGYVCCHKMLSVCP